MLHLDPSIAVRPIRWKGTPSGLLSRSRSRSLGGIVFVWLLLALVVTPDAGEAQGLHSLREYMVGQGAQDGRKTAIPPVAHFTTDEGDGFVFDTSQSSPLIRFDGDDEVWVLTPTPGPKGDVIFKNDIGEPVLRASRWGGFTLFRPDDPMGNPAALSGKAKAINMGRIPPDVLFQVIALSAKRASSAVGRGLPFSADEDKASAVIDYLIADAASNASDAVVTLSRQNQGKKLLESVREVRMLEGSPPSVELKDGVLMMRLDVSRGWNGRPSSRRIMSVIKSYKPPKVAKPVKAVVKKR
jgi:hypothetical protein